MRRQNSDFRTALLTPPARPVGAKASPCRSIGTSPRYFKGRHQKANSGAESDFMA